MLNYRVAVLGALLVLGTLLSAGTTGRTQAPVATDLAPGQAGQPDQAGVDVLARGPIHEAFAEPVTAQPQPTPVVPKPAPEPLQELPPDEKPQGDNVQWIPGYWSWDEDRTDYIWVSGFWRAPPPGRQWMPGHWAAAQGGCQWVPGFWAALEQPEVQFLPPPPEPVDAGPSVPAPAENSVYVTGNWVYRDAHYVWRPGYWVNYRPGWVWIPAHYVWTPVGYVFVDGYWDFELRRRGVLFAPVYIDRSVWIRPAFYYQPRYVVYDDFLLGALFVRPGYRHYYFGDYFEPVYARRGYTAWVDYRIGRHSYDPLFSYYRWHHRDNRGWEWNLRGLYVGRFNGDVPRPPRTLVQQNTLIQNITVNKTVNVTNVKNVTALAPLSQVDRSVVQLQPVTRERRAEAQRTAENLREVSRQRSRAESQLLAAGTAPVRATDKPRTVKLDLPSQPIALRTNEQVQPPPPPISPLSKPVPQPATGQAPVTPVRPERKGDQQPPRTEGKPAIVPPRPEGKPPITPPPGTTPLSPPGKPDGKPPVKVETNPSVPVPRSGGRPPTGTTGSELNRPPITLPKAESKPPVAPPPAAPPLSPAKNEGKPAVPRLEGRPPIGTVGSELAKPPITPPKPEVRSESRPPQHQPEVKSAVPSARPEANRPPTGQPKQEVKPAPPPPKSEVRSAPPMPVQGPRQAPRPDAGKPPAGSKPKPDDKPK